MKGKPSMVDSFKDLVEVKVEVFEDKASLLDIIDFGVNLKLINKFNYIFVNFKNLPKYFLFSI